MAKVIVCGGRTYEDRKRLGVVLSKLHAEQPFELVITGGAPGADRMAQAWAEERHIRVAVYPVNWKQGKRGGPMRNQAMLDYGKPDAVVVFPGGPGTEDMATRAMAARLPVIRVTPTSVGEWRQHRGEDPAPDGSSSPDYLFMDYGRGEGGR